MLSEHFRFIENREGTRNERVDTLIYNETERSDTLPRDLP